MLYTYSKLRYNDCKVNFYGDCQILFNKAEAFFAQKDYFKAEQLYQKVIDEECLEAPKAITKLNEIKSYNTARKEHSRVITYEWAKNLPLGISTGSYKKNRVGGFFSFSLNNKIFKYVQSECALNDYPEMKMLFGWTFHIAGPIWGFAGPGFAAKSYFGRYKDDNYPMYDKGSEMEEGEETKSYKELNKKINFSLAVPATAGLVAKYSYFALRLGYEYRFCLKKELESFMGCNRITLGIGFAL